MNDIKHTSGPWRVSGPNTGLQYNIQTDKDHIALVSHFKGGDLEGETNARLIAAAPDLLAACEAVLRLDYLNEHNALAQQVRAAITKATGGGK